MIENHSDAIKNYFTGLKRSGWLVTLTNDTYNEDEFPDIFKKCPNIVKDFIYCMDECANKSDDVWWLTPKVYLGVDEEAAFKWNEFETMSLESTDDQSLVVEYWRNVMPIMQSVKDGYSYIGIVIDGADAGAIIMAREPFFEEYDIIADDFESFLNVHLLAIESETESNIKGFI